MASPLFSVAGPRKTQQYPPFVARSARGLLLKGDRSWLRISDGGDHVLDTLFLIRYTCGLDHFGIATKPCKTLHYVVIAHKMARNRRSLQAAKTRTAI